ncbi:hypothetical protein AB833_25865 [Chromatiales bacterium (ex Bugula neritina AB1)]|nr:hypothetical protein AB833_25865 [Chromatiales bacterium (ex Bugula neritina AB1)]
MHILLSIQTLVNHIFAGLTLYSGKPVAVCLLLTAALNCLANNSLSEPVFRKASSNKVELGRLLFYDKILSGNKNISCSTCHHPSFGTSDGLSLGVGEGGTGVGPTRTTGTGKNRIQRRVPRNAPGLWNLGATEIRTLMHDGRIEQSNLYGNEFNTPAQEWLPDGLDSILAAQALFPMTSETEMAGSNEENEVAGAANDRIDNAWPIIARRVRAIPEYGERFVAAFSTIRRPEEVSIVEIANALAAFIAVEFRSMDSPFDRWRSGDTSALDARQVRGKNLFFGNAQCHHCHSGILFSNHSFKALGLPAFGPGRTRKFDPLPRDVGRMGESDRLEDAYRFRVPMLRNVELTPPYGHNGSYRTLVSMITHHAYPARSRDTWTKEELVLPKAHWLDKIDFIIEQDYLEMARQRSQIDINLPPLLTNEIHDLVAFLHALTGDQAKAQNFIIPERVPSGLPVSQRQLRQNGALP